MTVTYTYTITHSFYYEYDDALGVGWIVEYLGDGGKRMHFSSAGVGR